MDEYNGAGARRGREAPRWQRALDAGHLPEEEARRAHVIFLPEPSPAPASQCPEPSNWTRLLDSL
jgi:hypothetical protein